MRSAQEAQAEANREPGNTSFLCIVTFIVLSPGLKMHTSSQRQLAEWVLAINRYAGTCVSFDTLQRIREDMACLLQLIFCPVDAWGFKLV